MLRTINPVTLPPGRLRLATKPSLIGSKAAPARTIGIVEVALFASSADLSAPAATITAGRKPTRSAASAGKLIQLIIRPAEFDRHVPAL